jgi:hypothetical protein
MTIMIANLAMVEKEADESIDWLELIIESRVPPKPRLLPMIGETNQVPAMVAASQKTPRRRSNPKSKI